MQFACIKETCLYIRNLAQAKDFYHNLLGLPLVSYVEGRHIFFRAGSSMLLCFNPEATAEEQELPPHFASGNQHIAFECEEGSYESWKENIQLKGITIEHEANWGSSHRSFYFRDHEDNVLEVVQPGMWEY